MLDNIGLEMASLPFSVNSKRVGRVGRVPPLPVGLFSLTFMPLVRLKKPPWRQNGLIAANFE
jgi:hypothetical protein